MAAKKGKKQKNTKALPKVAHAKKLHAPERFKYVLSVGDEGAILVLFNAGKLEKRLFISSPASQDLTKTIAEHPKAPVYVLVDILDQAFVQHALPPVSPFAIGNLVKKRLEKDFAEQDIKAARKLYRDKKGRKDWHYMFLSLNYAPPFSDWVDAIINLPNPFGGIYLLPIESEPYLKKLETLNPKKSAKPVRWHIMVSHNRVGGFRQIVYRDSKVVFTRIAQPIGGLAPDVIAGNIEQETLNTIEYIRRLGFDNAEELDIYIICSQDVKNAIDANKIQGRTTNILTPFDVATGLKLQAAAEKTDRFGDVIFSSFFINNRKPILKLTTPYSKKLENLNLALKAAMATAAALIPTFFILSIMNISDIVDAKAKVEEVLQKKTAAQKELSDIQEIQKALPAFSALAVDVVTVNQAITKETSMPLTMMDDFAKLRTKNIEVQKLSFKVDERYSAPNRMVAVYSALISNPEGSIDRLLEDIDRFTEAVRVKFRGYEVSFSGLPGERSGTFNLNLDGQKPQDGTTPAGAPGSNKSPFEITIRGPITDGIEKKSGTEAAPARTRERR